jgi:hypothetical protein
VWIWDVESWISFVVFVASALFELYALCDAIVRPAQAFPAAGKLTKPAWFLILLLALLTCLTFRSSESFHTPIGIFGVLGLVAAGVYMADVRPALRQVTRR